jgi:hypothetical protein
MNEKNEEKGFLLYVCGVATSRIQQRQVKQRQQFCIGPKQQQSRIQQQLYCQQQHQKFSRDMSTTLGTAATSRVNPIIEILMVH